jgi:hypothetical protein
MGRQRRTERNGKFKTVLTEAEIIQFEEKHSKIAFYGFWTMSLCGTRG